MTKKLMMLFAVLAVGAIAAIAGVGALANNSSPTNSAPASAPVNANGTAEHQFGTDAPEAPEATTPGADAAADSPTSGSATDTQQEGEH